LLSKTRW